MHAITRCLDYTRLPSEAALISSPKPKLTAHSQSKIRPLDDSFTDLNPITLTSTSNWISKGDI